MALAYPNFGTTSITPPTAFPTSLAATTGTWSSGLIQCGAGAVLAATTSNQAGTITIQRYADIAGNVKVGALASATLSASTPQWVTVADALPYLTFLVTINNTGSTATITNCAILVGPL